MIGNCGERIRLRSLVPYPFVLVFLLNQKLISFAEVFVCFLYETDLWLLIKHHGLSMDVALAIRQCRPSN